MPRIRVLCVFLLLVACRNLTHETPTTASAEAPPLYVSLAQFPPLGEPKRVERGVVVHQVSLPHGQHADRIWIYLPSKLPKKPMPAVFIAPAGVPPIVGNGFGPDLDRQQYPEHLPYVHAGFAVVAYDVDGELPNQDEVSFEQVQTAATAFKEADAGMLNARHAIDYVLKMVPSINAKRLYSAGHSSAGRHALLLAERDSRIAACAAYAPVTDAEKRAELNVGDACRFLDENLPGFRAFLKGSSPLQQADKLRCPTFVFHSEQDERIPIADSEVFVAALQKTNPRVTFVHGTRGGHYDSMIEEGLPKAIDWMKQLN